MSWTIQIGTQNKLTMKQKGNVNDWLTSMLRFVTFKKKGIK